MTSGGNYPPDPYPGSYGYLPEANDSSEQRRRDDRHAYGPDPSERDAEAGSPVSGSPVSSASPAVARAAISMPGLRVEPPVDEQSMPGGPAPAGQVYGRPSPTTYGRPVSPSAAADSAAAAAHPDFPPPAPAAYPMPDDQAPARSAVDARDFEGPGRPRVYGQPQRPPSFEPEERPFDSDGRHGARAAVPGQRDLQREDSWDERDEAPSWEHDNDPRPWEQNAEAPSRQHDNDPRPWEQNAEAPSRQHDNDPRPWEQNAEAPSRQHDNDPRPWEQNAEAPSRQHDNDAPSWPQRDDPAPAERTPGLYGHAAATSSPAPQPLYGGAPPFPPSPADASSNGASRTPGAGDPNSTGLPNRATSAEEASSNGRGGDVPGANGPSPNAFGPGVYGAGVYGAATYGTPRDLGDRDDPAAHRNGANAEAGRNGSADPGEVRYGMARPAAPGSSEDAVGGDSGSTDNRADNNRPNGDQINGAPVPDAAQPRPAGVVYGTPRVYGSPRPAPENEVDDSDDSAAGFDDRREPRRFPDRPRSPGDVPARPFGEVPGRAVADMPGRPAAGDGPGRRADGIGRLGDGPDRSADAMDRTWAENAMPPVAPTSPSATRAGQTYGSSRPPIDWSVQEQDDRARFASPFAPSDGVRIPTGTSSFTSPGSLGGDGNGSTPGAADPGLAPEPRRLTRTAGIVAIVVIVIGLAAGALYYTSRPNAPSYQIGSCVQHSGDKVNGAACTAPNSFKIVSKVSDPGACPKANDPYLYLDNDKSTVYCLAPNQP